MTIDLIYTGIGSREVDYNSAQQLGRFAKHVLSEWTVQTGEAKGCDSVFINNGPNVTVFCATKKAKSCLRPNVISYGCPSFDNWDDAVQIAKFYHPNWSILSPVARNLITRNTYQVLGLNLNEPSNFILCWTPDGSTGITSSKTGGTGQAIRIAYDYNIPILNLGNPSHTISTVYEFLSSNWSTMVYPYDNVTKENCENETYHTP